MSNFNFLHNITIYLLSQDYFQLSSMCLKIRKSQAHSQCQSVDLDQFESPAQRHSEERIQLLSKDIGPISIPPQVPLSRCSTADTDYRYN